MFETVPPSWQVSRGFVGCFLTVLRDKRIYGYESSFTLRVSSTETDFNAWLFFLFLQTWGCFMMSPKWLLYVLQAMFILCLRMTSLCEHYSMLALRTRFTQRTTESITSRCPAAGCDAKMWVETTRHNYTLQWHKLTGFKIKYISCNLLSTTWKKIPLVKFNSWCYDYLHSV